MSSHCYSFKNYQFINIFLGIQIVLMYLILKTIFNGITILIALMHSIIIIYF